MIMYIPDSTTMENPAPQRATSIQELSQYAKGRLVRLPDTAEGMPLYVMMKRPSLLDLIAQGKIPNPLANTANSLFMEGSKGLNKADSKQMKELNDILHIFCEVSFMEPTYAEMKEVGFELTDEQLMFVFNYIQAGTKALERFRPNTSNTVHHGGIPAVQKDPLGDTGDR